MSKLIPAVLVATALLATACGSSETPAAPQTQAGQNQGAFPVRVEHKYGTTEIAKKAERVVTLGLNDQDAVLALGVRPVGAIDWFGERPYGQWPWTKELWGDKPPEVVGKRDDYDVEKIIDLKPDLIIGLYSGMTREQYDTLSKIAPTVAQPKGYEDWLAPWQEMTKLTGLALGMPAKVDELIAGIDARFATVRKEHPDWAGKSVAVVDSFQPGQYAIFAPGDPKAQFLTGLGFKVSDRITKEAGTQNALEVSSERLDLIDVDRVVFLTSDPAAEGRIKADQVYQSLKVAKDGRALFVPYATPPVGAAISFNTVLSIPYAIDQLAPLLAAGAQ
ncbi:iron-siderophore ABC transporter substrate-binding protein [Actinophytocola sp.]|uniref:iron-siderophore ABC transporter substrate-binding protein n=1 Tax=Actinophytocola sp. TaxID=1872138 RepID=UPI002D7E7262|nr:iron-siderophore ABC transporter substrate-binding protein [Actinophytocola sp.]HET9144361.1 iron-siderophore ABC transporter substrate-binding protein [Actinophytocola sp.]